MPDTAPNELLVAFGAAVRDVRKRRGLSQEGLAELADLHRTYIADIERGERNVGLVNIDRLAQALGVDLPGLMADTEAARRPRP